MGPILYLDYDGVLHPSDVRITKAEPLRPRIYQNGRPTDRLLFENAPLLACILEAFPEVRISLATSWVRILGYEFAVQQLPPALRARVVGTIWQGSMLRFPRSGDMTPLPAMPKNGGGGERWLALDDDIEGWPADRRHLVIAPTDSWQGLPRWRLCTTVPANWHQCQGPVE